MVTGPQRKIKCNERDNDRKGGKMAPILEDDQRRLQQQSREAPARVFQAEGSAHAKALRQEHSWCINGTTRRKSVWLEQRNGRER